MTRQQMRVGNCWSKWMRRRHIKSNIGLTNSIFSNRPNTHQDNNTEELAEDEASKETVSANPADAELRVRASRSMLSATTTVPERLLQMFEIPEGCSISRTVHRDSTLPLFQGRLPLGKLYEGKSLVSKVW